MGKTRVKTLRETAGKAALATAPAAVAPSVPAPEPVEEAAPPGVPFDPTRRVELIEGQTYQVGRTTFFRNRPVPVTDPRIWERVSHCSRFRVLARVGEETR